ncbi:MAG: endonuclease/exonuclease/phosphatase family protein [Myxococcales bacterium]
MRFARTAALLSLLAVAACSEPAGPSGQDAGGRDASARRDASQLADASESAGLDAGELEAPDGGALSAADTGTAATTIQDFWANTQWPAYLTLTPGEQATIYGQIWIPGRTDQSGAMAGLEVEAGLGAPGTEPATWTWTSARYNVEKGNNDEWLAKLTAPGSGAREYAFRYRVPGSVWAGQQGEWLYAGLKGPTLAPGEAGVMAVRVPAGQVVVATQNLHCQHDDPKGRFDAIAARWAALKVDVAALQEVCEDASTGVGNSADYLAKALTAATGRTYGYVWVQTHLANDVTPEGVGLVSALPLAGQATVDHVTADLPRKALLGAYATPAGILAVVTSHLSYRTEDADARLQQANQLVALATEWQTGPSRTAGTHALIAGDFNTAPDTAPIQAVGSAGFTDVWAAVHPGDPGLSFPSYAPNKRIDYLLFRSAAGIAAAPTSATEEFGQPYTGTSYVSDHLGFVATLKAP